MKSTLTRRTPNAPAVRSAARVVCGALAGGLLTVPSLFAAPPLGHAVPVPGGLASLLETAGLPAGLERDAALLALLRRLHRGHVDRPSPLAQCLGHLSAAAADSRAGTGAGPDSVWLPLSAELWDAAVFGRALAPRERLEALLGDRSASRLALGLHGLDPPTLEALAADPEALEALRRESAEAFALFGPAVRVRGGAVDVPGGAEGRALFESLSGCRSVPPARFLACLMGAREGRVAWLYATLAGLDEPRLRFALALADHDPRRGAATRSALSAAFLAAEPFWRPDRAGVRVFPDAAWVLRHAPVDAGGRLVGGFSAREWQAVLDGERPSAPGQGVPDSAWLVGAVVRRNPAGGRERLGRLRFAARVLAANPSLPFARLEPIARGYARAPALFLTLERLDLLDAELLRRAATALDGLSSLGDGGRARDAVAQFQGALALGEVAARARELPRESVASLCRSLFDLRVDESGFAGTLAAWLEGELLPRLRDGDPESSDLDAEETLTRTLSGTRVPAVLSWEGLRYRVDVAAAWQARFREARARQGGARLDQVLREVREAARRGPAPAAREAADARLARVLSELAYATVAATFEDVGLARLAWRHEIGPVSLDGDRLLVPAWALPELRLGRGWTVSGSLLALESALARSVLHRLDEEPPLERPVLDPLDRETVALGVAQMRPLALTDATRDALFQALKRGRHRATSTGLAAIDATARELGLDPWRREAWRRSAASGASPPFLALSELAALGGAPHPACDAWGASVARIGGGLCLSAAPLEPWSAGAGFGDEGVMAAGVPDLALRVLEVLAEAGLPAALAPPLAARTAPDLIDLARPADAADGLALARVASELGRSRIDDAIASLTATGALVPLAGPDEAAR